MDKGIAGPAQLLVYVCSDKQAEAQLQIHYILTSLTQTLRSTLGPALSTTLSPMDREQVKLAEHLSRMGRAGPALLGRSPRLTSR